MKGLSLGITIGIQPFALSRNLKAAVLLIKIKSA